MATIRLRFSRLVLALALVTLPAASAVAQLFPGRITGAVHDAQGALVVTPITIQYVNEIYEFRAAVEGMSAELAAQKTPNKERMDRLFELAQTEHRLEDRASYVRFIEADTEFHVGIAELTRNLLLIRAVADMRCQMERIMYASIDVGYYGELPLKEHLAILDAIQNRDPDAARKHMCDHIFISRDKVLRLATRSFGNS